MTPRALVLCIAMGASALGCGGPFPAREPAARPLVQLVRARLPMPLRIIAVHYWFTAYDPSTRAWERWEVWQASRQNATSWGHVHRDLMPPWSNVGGGEAVIEAEWLDDDASRLLSVLRRSHGYPDRDTYRAWPGPNSNSYVAWVLRESNVSADLGPLGIGKDWRGWVGGGVTTTGTGIHFDTPLLGVKLGLLEGVELHILALTFGFSALRPTLKTPFGSIALPELP